MPEPMYKLHGMLMSPFSMKLRAYLRYRHIPFQWCNSIKANEIAQTKVKTYMVPVIEYPDGRFENDSTPIIDKLEAAISTRRTEPDNEADAFLAFLIEDFADEWLLWPFFMYRWRTEADRTFNSEWINYEALHGQVAGEHFSQMSAFWAQRQTKLVKKTCGGPENHAVLERSLADFLGIMEDAVKQGLFFFGTRPSRAEIAIFGVLSQLVQDFTASAMLRNQAPFTMRWVGMIDDLSGIDGDWEPLHSDSAKLMSSPVRKILEQSAKYHLPLLLANDQALAAGDAEMAFDIDGHSYRRAALPRHSGCLPALVKRYAVLSNDSKAALDPVLSATGCLDFLTS
ncbi:MAG: glutathione S-transferase N-terminal domain-containing protein [Maricaulis sp.]|uniref:glutathione S-transferase N-terminal domain-containing protein n=1 Tax=Maricaulis sp. TaxID=1486257 RepID=UPI001B086E76|nr:glutathione S-transferase N-terminal domain-containing protein [Maricaulis sp.]MBO6729088.1 glutathione S-transferase N-terminal domain-containing protein [Maricaulis sp.]MBO6878362.1 glutathione S-transferase N-terminal domain-containing protein [Maricaulis sp.]